MAGAEVASRVESLLENTSTVCILSYPYFTNLLNISTITFRNICGGKKWDKDLCPHIVGPARIKRVSGFYSKLDGDKGSHNKEHRKATGGTRDVCAQMCVGVCKLYAGRRGRAQRGGKWAPWTPGSSCVGRGQRAQAFSVALLILAVWAGQCRFISPGCYAEEKKGAGEVRQLWPAISL